MNEELEQKVDEMGILEDLNQTLIVKERQSNNDLQARKELIAVYLSHVPAHMFFISPCHLCIKNWMCIKLHIALSFVVRNSRNYLYDQLDAMNSGSVI